MNRIYKVVWNKARECYMVVSEYAKAQTKSCSISKLFASKTAAKMALGAIVIAGAMQYAPNVNAEATVVAPTLQNYLAYQTKTTTITPAVYYYSSNNGSSFSQVYKYSDGNYYDAASRGTLVSGATDSTVIKYNLMTVKDSNNESYKYYVRDGYTVKLVDGAYHASVPTDKKIKIEAYATGTTQNDKYTVTSGRNVIEDTADKTVINNDYLHKLSYNTFAGITNTGSTTSPVTFQYYIQRNGKFINVGSNQTTLDKNFHAVSYDTATKTYYLTGDPAKKVVDFQNVYYIGNTLGAFTVNEFTSTTPISQIEVYTGSVYGHNNEVFVTAKDNTTGNWTSVWGATITDPDATIDTMTVGQLNNILNDIHNDDVILSNADVAKAKVSGSANDATVNLVNKKGNDVPGFKLASTSVTGKDTVITVSPDTGSDGSDVTLAAGSRVSGDSKTALTTLTINGEDYKIQDNDTKYTAGTNVTISDDNVISATDTNTTNASMAVAGDAEKTITLTDSAGNKVEAKFTDNDTKYTAGTNVTIDGTTISATDTNTVNKSVEVTGEATKTITITDSDNKTVTTTFTDKDTTYTAGDNVTISADNKISAKDTTNKTLAIAGDAEKTITLTDSAGNKVEAKFTDNDTKYTAGTNVTIDGTTISATHNKLTNLTITPGQIGSYSTNQDSTTTYTQTYDVVIKDADGNPDIKASFTVNDKDTTYSAGDNILITNTGVISAIDTKFDTISRSGNTVNFYNNGTSLVGGINFTSGGGNTTDGDTYVGISVGNGEALKLQTGSKVTGNNTDNLTVLNINGTDYNITGQTYTAGTNVQIKDNVISATDTTYTAGANITITQNEKGENVITAVLEGAENTVNKSVAVTGDTTKTITITDSANNTVTTEFTDNDTKYTAGTNVTISEDNVISATDTNTTNASMGVAGDAEKTITLTDSEGNKVEAKFTDNDTKYTAGTNVTISADNQISAKDTVNTGVTVTGEGTKTITITDSDKNTVTANFTDNDTKYTAGTNVTISEDNVISATDTNTTNASMAVTGDATKTITITDSDNNTVTAEFTDNDTKYTAGTNVTISADNQISAKDTVNTGVTVTGDTTKTITITDSDNNTVTTTFTDNDTTYTAGSNITITVNEKGENVISANLEAAHNTVNTGVTVTGDATKTITITDSDNNTVTAEFTDNDTKYTAGTNVTISADNQISAKDTVNTGVTVTGDTTKTITITDSDNNTVTAEFTDNDTQYTAGTNVTISADNQISAKDTVNTGVTVTGDATKTITITDSDNNTVTAEFTDNDTKYTAGTNVTISADNQISAKDTVNTGVTVTGEATKTITITDSDKNTVTTTFTDNDTTYTAGNNISISDDNVISVVEQVESVSAEWDSNDKHSITIQLNGSNNGTAVAIGTEQTIDNIALSSEVGDIEDSTYVSNFGSDTPLVNAVNTTYEEALKHTTVVLGEDEKNLALEENENANGGKEYTLTMSRDIDIDTAKVSKSITVGDKTTINNDGVTTNSVTVGDVVINENGINAGGQKITNVAPGEAPDDAVNVSQLFASDAASRGGDEILNQRINKLGNRVNKVGAGAAALSALHPMEFDPDDKLSFAVGAGHYKGENATALGAFYRPDEKVLFSVGGTIGNGQDMVNVGASFSLDRTPSKTNTKTAMAKEIVELRERLAQMEKYMMKQQGFQPLSGEMKLFPDVPENHWAYEYVAKLYADGIIDGYPDGNFAGDRMMTRYEFAALLYRAMQKGANLDSKILGEFEPELCRVRVDRISGLDDDYRKIERVRVNTGLGKDKYGNKIKVAEKAKK